MTDSAASAAERYTALLREWCAIPTAEYRRANAVFEDLHAEYKRVRDTPDGRAAIEALMTDPNLCVRVAASISALKWNSEVAVSVLRDVAVMEGEWEQIGKTAMNAKYSLREWEAGRLDLDW